MTRSPLDDLDAMADRFTGWQILGIVALAATPWVFFIWVGVHWLRLR